jgi:hypothetical protein
MFKNNVFNVSVNTRKWFKAAGVRAVKTMAQVASSMLVIGAFNETAWTVMIETTLVAGLASVLTSVAGIPEVKEEKKYERF